MHITGKIVSALLIAASALADEQTCAGCDDEAHGFASLNGGTTGGKGGRVVTAKTHEDLIKYAAATEPLIIRVDGMLKADPFGFEVPVKSHKTIIGVGAESGIEEGGLNINSQTNVIIRNLNIHGTYDGVTNWAGKEGDYDAIQIDNSTNIWIDGNHVSSSLMTLAAPATFPEAIERYRMLTISARPSALRDGRRSDRPTQGHRLRDRVQQPDREAQQSLRHRLD